MTRSAMGNLEFEAFIGPSGQNQLYHIPLLFKILDLTENKKIVNNPFKHTILKGSFTIFLFSISHGAASQGPLRCELRSLALRAEVGPVGEDCFSGTAPPCHLQGSISRARLWRVPDLQVETGRLDALSFSGVLFRHCRVPLKAS